MAFRRAVAGASHPVLSGLGFSLKKLGDLERGITRAFHGTIRPADFAALLQTFGRCAAGCTEERQTRAASPCPW